MTVGSIKISNKVGSWNRKDTQENERKHVGYVEGCDVLLSGKAEPPLRCHPPWILLGLPELFYLQFLVFFAIMQLSWQIG